MTPWFSSIQSYVPPDSWEERIEARFAGDSRTHSLSSPLSPGGGVVKPRSTTKAQHEYKCQGRSRSGLFNLWRKRKKLNRFTESGDKSIYAHCVRLWDHSTLTPKSQILGILELQRLYWNTKATRLRGRNEAMQGATHPGQTFQGRWTRRRRWCDSGILN